MGLETGRLSSRGRDMSGVTVFERDGEDKPLARCGKRLRSRRGSAFLALTLLVSAAVYVAPVTASAATPRRMSPLQVANLAVTCATHDAGSNKVTTYHDIKCAANHSSNISVVTGVVGGPPEYPEYSSIGFLFNSVTRVYTCFAYPNKVGARPVNITENCPLWIIPREYAKTNYPFAYALASTFPSGSPPPTLDQVQSAASSSQGMPSVTSGSGAVFAEGIIPTATFQMSYGSGIGRDWCLWFYQQADTDGQSETASLVSPPGMYGTC
jgi:hypothetical protein